MGKHVTIRGLRPGGMNLYAETDRPSARAAGVIVENAGAGGHDKFKLRTFLRSKNNHIFAHAGIDDEAASISGSAATAELETLLQLMYLKITAPRKDPQAFRDW